MALLDRFKKSSEAEIPNQKVSDTPKAKAKTKAKSEVAKTSKKKKEASTKKTSVTPRGAKLGQLILKPVVTEKSTIMAENGTYVFFVDSSVNKIQIKQAVREVYGVVPTAVRVINQKGKVVRWGRIKGKRSDMKKAYVTLKKGDSIDLSA